MTEQQFIEYLVHDVMAFSSNITYRPMFGGFGIYHNQRIIGIVIDNELYLKVNESAARLLAEQGSRPFTYERTSKVVALKSYWLVPEEILENRDQFRTWFSLATTSTAK